MLFWACRLVGLFASYALCKVFRAYLPAGIIQDSYSSFFLIIICLMIFEWLHGNKHRVAFVLIVIAWTEGVIPLIVPYSVGDISDVVAMLAGAFIYAHSPQGNKQDSSKIRQRYC